MPRVEELYAKPKNIRIAQAQGPPLPQEDEQFYGQMTPAASLAIEIEGATESEPSEVQSVHGIEESSKSINQRTFSAKSGAPIYGDDWDAGSEGNAIHASNARSSKLVSNHAAVNGDLVYGDDANIGQQQSRELIYGDDKQTKGKINAIQQPVYSEAE